MKSESDQERKRCEGKIAVGFKGAEGCCEDRPVIWLLPVYQAKQPLITPAVVFMFLHTFTRLHFVVFDFA